MQPDNFFYAASRTTIKLISSARFNPDHAAAIVVAKYDSNSLWLLFNSYRQSSVVVVVGSRKVSGLTPTAVFALATPKSPIDRGGRWQLHCVYTAIFFYFSVLLSDTHQGRT
jgi:hypothetical protein